MMHTNLIKMLVDQLTAATLRDAEARRAPANEVARPSPSPEGTSSPQQRAAGARDPVSTPTSEIRPELVDRMIELYCDWRTECGQVEATYERFLQASAPDRAAAFAAYGAALDQEQCACESYADQVRLIESHFAGDTVPVGRGGPPVSRRRVLVHGHGR